MADVHAYVADYLSPGIATYLLQDNPAALLSGGPVRPVFQQF